MKLTTKGRYAITAMLDLEIQHTQDQIPLADIAQRQTISPSYLVNSVREPGGGYILSRPPAAISIADVIRAVDDNLDTTRCGSACNCKNNAPCLIHELWYELEQRIDHYLNTVILQHLLDQQPPEKLSTPAFSQQATHFPTFSN